MVEGLHFLFVLIKFICALILPPNIALIRRVLTQVDDAQALKGSFEIRAGRSGRIFIEAASLGASQGCCRKL